MSEYQQLGLIIWLNLVDELNDTETEMIGMKPKDAILLDEVPLVKQEAYPEEDELPEDGFY